MLASGSQHHSPKGPPLHSTYWRAWTLPVRRVVPVSLLEGSERRICVIDRLFEGRHTSTAVGSPLQQGHSIVATRESCAG